MEVFTSSKKELVKFQKLKMKYFQNEDIKVEYVLDPQARQRPKDWIGLYPSGWNHLQQYITFEWVVCRPCDEKSPYRIEIFKHQHHSEAITFDKLYQFVYADKNMKVLGSSAFFGFLPPIPFSSVVKSDVSMLYSQRNGLKRAPNVYKLLKPTIPPLKLSDVKRLPTSQDSAPDIKHHIPEKPLQELRTPLNQIDNSNNGSQSSQTDICLSEADLCDFKQDAVPNDPSQLNKGEEEAEDNLCESESINKEVKSTTPEEILFLQNKIKELEVSLEKSRVSQKIFRITAQRSKREKMAYQNFVSELLDALSKKKVVRVIDGQGTEMLVKCVQNTENEDEQSSIPQPNAIKETPRERRLKAVIGFQEQTIQQLQHRLACILKENESSKESKPDGEKQPDSSEPEPLFTVVRKSMPSTTGISEMHADYVSEQKNETVNNFNDITVSNVDEGEPQTCIPDAETTEMHDEQCAIQDIVPDSVTSASGDCCEVPESSVFTVSEDIVESDSAPDTEITFKANSDTATAETEKVKVVTSAVSPATVVIHGEKVSFSIVK